MQAFAKESLLVATAPAPSGKSADAVATSRPKSTSTINSPDLPLLKIRRLSRVLLLAKGDKDVTSAYCSKRRIRMRACHAHVQIQLLLFFYLSPVSLSLEGFLKGLCDWRFRPYNTSPCLHTYYEWGTTGSFSGYVGKGLKRNWRTNAVGIVHDVVAEVATAAAHDPNASVAASEVARRQRPPPITSSIFL